MFGFIKDFVGCKKITDFLLTGNIDPDEEVIEFLPDFTFFTIQFDEKYLTFESIEQYSKIRISEENNLLFHDVKDEDFKKSYVSLINFLVINGEYSNEHIDTIILFNSNSSQGKIVCDAVKIVLSNGQVFFLEPFNFWGFNMGGETVEKNWIDNLRAVKDERILDCKLTIIK